MWVVEIIMVQVCELKMRVLEFFVAEKRIEARERKINFPSYSLCFDS